jgi:Mrp family chromosome partitioning ATPase
MNERMAAASGTALPASRQGRTVTLPGLTRPSAEEMQIASRVAAGRRGGDVILFCGLTRHAGVSALTVQLAQAIAGLTGLAVAVVDAQTDDPALARAAGLQGVAGLTDLLAEHAPAEAPLHPVAGTTLSLVGPGTRPDLAEAAGSAAAGLDRGIARLRQMADIVCLIGAPVTSAIGTALLARHASGVVVCTHRGRDRRPDLGRVADDLAAAGSRLIGAVLIR